MKALLFRYSMPRLAAAKITSLVSAKGFVGPWAPLQLEEVPEPRLMADDWVLVKNRLTGICGSDAKQVFLKGSFDNPMTAVISFPHILGHETVGTIEKVGPAVKGLSVGQRVVLNPWLSCGPRGIQPPCAACAVGDFSMCENFTSGRLPAGIHMGNCQAVGGAFAPYYSAHESQLIPVSDGITDTQAVLSDPFSVQLHAILRHPPQTDLPAVVYGCGDARPHEHRGAAHALPGAAGVGDRAPPAPGAARARARRLGDPADPAARAHRARGKAPRRDSLQAVEGLAVAGEGLGHRLRHRRLAGLGGDRVPLRPTRGPRSWSRVSRRRRASSGRPATSRSSS
jgi:hypothetical protein